MLDGFVMCNLSSSQPLSHSQCRKISANGYHSYKEDGYLDFYTQDISFKILYDVKGRLDRLRKKYGRKKELEGKEKGLISGEKIGMVKGLKEGRKEGLEEGEYNKAVEIAKNLLKLNLDIEDIVKSTELSEDEINKLK